jgi:hypothetical protein
MSHPIQHSLHMSEKSTATKTNNNKQGKWKQNVVKASTVTVLYSLLYAALSTLSGKMS